MPASPDERRELIERIEAATLDQMTGWGMNRYNRVFGMLAAERSAIEDTHRHVHQDGTVEDLDPHALRTATARVDAAEAKIIAAIVKGSRPG